ncbi:MAG TPA: MFS transporter [Chitinophagales bacterium]|nr:MFS transporter [Chitinophagales bacterium]HNM31904.1 MFS transporter [Chitinophagales bacterium]
MINQAAKYYLNSYKGLTRDIWLLSFVNLINRCGTMVIPFLMLYLTSQLGCSISQAGIVISLWGVGAFIGGYFGGRLTDTIGFQKVQLTALFFGGVGFIVLGYLRSYLTICGFTFILALVNESFRPANSAAIGKYSTEENRMRSFTLMRLSFNLGWALGAGIGGFIAHHSYSLLFWVDGVTNILAAILLWQLLPAENTNTASPHKTNEKPKQANTIWRDKLFVQFVFISILYLSCFVQLFTNLPVYFKEQLHLEETDIGYLGAWNGIMIVLFEMTVIFWIERNWSAKKAVTIGVAMHALAYLLACFSLNFLGAFTMMTFITLSEMLAFSVLVNFWMRRTNDTNRGQYAAIWTMTWAFSQTVGPFLGAVVVQNSNFITLWVIVALLSLTATGLYYKVIENK